MNVIENDANALSAMQGEKMKVTRLKEWKGSHEPEPVWRTAMHIPPPRPFFSPLLTQFNRSLNQDREQLTDSQCQSSGISGVNTGR